MCVCVYVCVCKSLFNGRHILAGGKKCYQMKRNNEFSKMFVVVFSLDMYIASCVYMRMRVERSFVWHLFEYTLKWADEAKIFSYLYYYHYYYYYHYCCAIVCHYMKTHLWTHSSDNSVGKYSTEIVWQIIWISLSLSLSLSSMVESTLPTKKTLVRVCISLTMNVKNLIGSPRYTIKRFSEQSRCFRGVMVKALDFGIVVCEFALQSRS